MQKLKRRKNGKGTAIFLGEGRNFPWVARILIGKDIEGKPLFYDIDTFETELEALVCLENYHNNPTPIQIKEEKYNRIVTFPRNPYPLIPTKNPNQDIIEKVKKENYTFKQLYELFKEEKMLTKEEMQQEKKYHIRPKNKPFSRCYCLSLITAFHNSSALHDKVYKNLRVSDFNKHLKESKKGISSQRQMINLFANLDKFALEEDIIDKGYAQFISTNINNKKEIKNSKHQNIKKEKIFTYEQIDYLWNFMPRTPIIKPMQKQYKEEFIRDFWLMLLYTGMRADELLSVYTNNVFLDDNYIIGGLKTDAGINREIPIHPKIKSLFEKYYNPKNEFLFMRPNGNKIDYDYYLYHYKNSFKNLHPEVSEHTAHDARHTLRNELRKIGIKDIIINSIIGHSNDDVGEDIYSHISIEEKLEAIKLITYKKSNNLYLFTSGQVQNAM